MKLINPSPRLYNDDLAPAVERKWGAFSIFNVWTSDVHSLWGYYLAASLFLLCGNFINFIVAIGIGSLVIFLLMNLVGFAGVKGFAGGFGRGALGPWGEHATKAFVQEAVDEALKLETALARLRTQKRVALLHYSPIRGTVEGEPPEIFAYLGSSRLEEPINRYRVNAVFHGHAHRGTPEGRTSTGVPVHNVSMPLLTRVNPNRPPFLIVEVPRDVADVAAPVEPRGEPLVKSA